STFDVNPVAEKLEALELTATLGKQRGDPYLVEYALDTLQSAIVADDYDRAQGALDLALTGAGNMKNQALVAWVEKQSDRIKRWRAESERVRPQRDKGNDPDANLALGRFAAFWKGDWNGGLYLLTIGSDPDLAALARKDREGLGNAAGRAEVG